MPGDVAYLYFESLISRSLTVESNVRPTSFSNSLNCGNKPNRSILCGVEELVLVVDPLTIEARDGW